MIQNAGTAENLHLLTALGFYSRLRMTQNLLPLLSLASHNGELSRVVNIAGGTKEGTVYTNDFPGFGVSLLSIRGHLTSMITLSHFALAQQYPEVTFLQLFPGSVNTSLMDNIQGILGIALRSVAKLGTATGLGGWISIEECAQRCTFTSTTAVYPPAQVGKKSFKGTPLLENLQEAPGADGQDGSGVYSVDWDGAVASKQVIGLLSKYRKDSTMEKLMEHVNGEFERITSLVIAEA
jgi:hypothetical protein